MSYCEKCGKELLDEASVCVGCGCELVKNSNIPQKEATDKLHIKHKIKKTRVILIVVLSVVLLAGIASAVLFLPRNLKLDDFKQTNVVTAILRYGLPSSIETEDGDTYLRYNDKVDFYGITSDRFCVYPDENEVQFFFLSEDDASNVYKKIANKCDREKSSSDSFYHVFSYDNLTITTWDYDGTSVRIEID